MDKKRIFHVQQRDRTDCGAACLLAALRYYGRLAGMEQLREMTGTGATGATLLGLYQGATEAGFKAEGCQADMEALKGAKQLAILHVETEELSLHYVLCYGYDEQARTFLIGDPARPSVHSLTQEELAAIWRSGYLLLLEPTERFQEKGDEAPSGFRWILSFLREDLNLLGTSAVIGAFVALMGLAVAIFSQYLIDDILPGKDARRLFIAVGLLVFILLLRSLLNLVRSIFLIRQGQSFNFRLISHFYRSLLYLPKVLFDRRKTGDFISRLNDTGRIQQTLAQLSGNYVIDALTVIVSSAGLFFYSPVVGWVSLLWIPLYAALVYWFQPGIVEAQRQVMVHHALNESNYIDTVQGIGTIKAKNREPFFLRHTNVFNEGLQSAIYRLGKLGLGFGLAGELLGALFMAGIILLSSMFIFKGSLSEGSVIAIIQLTSAIMGGVSRLALGNIAVQEAKVALERMRELATARPEYTEDSEKGKAQPEVFQSLSVSGLSFRYRGRPLLLQNISIEVRRGEVIALLGESGCGKSTLLELIQRFQQPESGGILINGLDLRDVSTQAWRGLLGVVPQQVKLFSGYVWDNILMEEPPADISGIRKYLVELGLDKHFEKFPSGYDTLLGEGGARISGGQQQILGLARALHHKPQLLLLDEATASMDRHMENDVLQLLQALKPGLGIVIATHRIKTAAIADRIYIIEGGRIAASGSPQALMETNNLFSQSVRELNF